MAVIAVDSTRLSNLLKHEYEPSNGFCREVFTVNEAAAKSYDVGTVLGIVSATGKAKICVQSASDGSQVAAGVVIGDVLGDAHPFSVAATTDTKVLVLARGPVELADTAIKWDASFDTQAKKDTAFATLKAAGVLIVPAK